MEMRHTKNLAIYIVLIVMLALIIFPMGWMVLLAFTPREFIFKRIIPPSFTLQNFIDIIKDKKVLLTYRNSWIIAGGGTLLTIFLSTLSGYGLSRYRFSLRNFYITFILITQMLPLTLLVISYFRIISKIGLYNSPITLILVDSTLAIPFSTLLAKSIFDGIPRALEEVAMVDGCSKGEAFIKITLPLASSGLFAVGFFSFLVIWIEYLYGLTLTGNALARPITVELGIRLGHYATSWGEMMAMASLMSLPLFIMFTFFQNIFLKGFTAGALKE